MKRFLWVAPFLAMALSGGDISGRWTGVIEVSDASSGTVVSQAVRADFEQKANAVSGRIGRQEDELGERIRNGRVEGNHVVFEVASPETDGIFKFDLTMQGDRLEGMMKGAIDTGPISGKVHLARHAAH